MDYQDNKILTKEDRTLKENINRIALLIPVYNNQKGLAISLSSIQDEIVDIIVVDDGSEVPIQISADLLHANINLIRLEKNQGITSALNEGLRYILDKGYKYLARLDAGDIVLPVRFLKQFTFLEKNPNYALVGGQVKFVDPNGQELWKERFPTKYEDIKRIMHSRNCFIHPAVMMRTDVLRELGGYSADYPAAEDYELFMRIVKRYSVANLDEVVLVYEVNPFSISIQKRRRQVLSRLKVMLRYFDPAIKESYLGILKNVFLLTLPYSFVITIKKLFRERESWL
ncbi:MAG: glycosyl transferase, family 2 [Anaerolineae bacterium]|nr:MAG: glycosyl transferase, family 2 [Anaerolineae bacterium]